MFSIRYMQTNGVEHLVDNIESIVKNCAKYDGDGKTIDFEHLLCKKAGSADHLTLGYVPGTAYVMNANGNTVAIYQFYGAVETAETDKEVAAA